MASSDYPLDMRCQMMLDDFNEFIPTLQQMELFVKDILAKRLNESGIRVTALESRIKTEASLAGKLELKGHKYQSIDDITDLLGVRVITFYNDEVDTIAALVEQLFDIDWENSTDKRKLLEIDRFGYMSLHYICRIPQHLLNDPDHPQLNNIRFEIQMRTALQHVWANMYHDTGYKSGVEIPPEHIRSLNRLAGILELADEQFGRIRKEINDYRRNVQALVASGNFDEVPLNGDTFRSYLQLKPFNQLAEKIASINQAEIYNDSLFVYLDVLFSLGFKTLGDIERLRTKHSEQAFQIALIQLAGTGLDIIAYSITLQNLCIAYILSHGYGEGGLLRFYNHIYGANASNAQRVTRTIEQAKKINLLS